MTTNTPGPGDGGPDPESLTNPPAVDFTLAIPMRHEITTGRVTFFRRDDLPGNALAQFERFANEAAEPGVAAVTAQRDALLGLLVARRLDWPLLGVAPRPGPPRRWCCLLDGSYHDDEATARGHALAAAAGVAATRAAGHGGGRRGV